jgi:very-short-patch-repair endonuclease
MVVIYRQRCPFGPRWRSWAGRPEVQVSIHNAEGRFVGRPDLLYLAQRLAIEYDGGNHRDRLVEDNRRQNGLVGAGFQLLRFTAADVFGTPDVVAMQVRHALAKSARSIVAR